jgi:hypothetical protein
MLAFRQHHFLAFWLGRPERMWQVVEGVLPRWGAGLPGYGTLLACRAFAAEECGFYTIAENAGREAVRIDPADPWAAHAVAHVLEMQGRHAEGIDWVVGLQRHWDGVNNLAHHLWWHRALHHIERQEWPMVLELYDKRFRNLGSPVTQLQPDLYIDMQNAASALFRLQLHEVHVGDRWVELADKGEARIGDCASPFSLPHFMMALAATHRFEAAQQMLAEMREFAAAGQGSLAPLVGAVALPVTEAVLAWYRGDFAGAVTLMHPVLGEMHRLGGSHAQQDVLEQLFVDAALKAGRTGEVRLLLERVAGRHPLPPSRCIGYARAAREIHF